MQVGTQFAGPVPAGASKKWFTHSWPVGQHVVWTVVPTTIGATGAQVAWDVQVQMAGAGLLTYWITVRNLSAAEVQVQGRYAVLT